jgi:hypothetical protein
MAFTEQQKQYIENYEKDLFKKTTEHYYSEFGKYFGEKGRDPFNTFETYFSPKDPLVNRGNSIVKIVDAANGFKNGLKNDDNGFTPDEKKDLIKGFMAALQNTKKDLMNLNEMKFKRHVLDEMDKTLRGSYGEQMQKEFMEKSGIQENSDSYKKFAETIMELYAYYDEEVTRGEGKLKKSMGELSVYRDLSNPALTDTLKNEKTIEFECNRHHGGPSDLQLGTESFDKYASEMFERNFRVLQDPKKPLDIYKNLFVGGLSLDHLAAIEFDGVEYMGNPVTREEWMQSRFMLAAMNNDERLFYSPSGNYKNTIEINVNKANMFPPPAQSTIFDAFCSAARAIVNAVEWGLDKFVGAIKMLINPNELANESAPENRNKSTDFANEQKPQPKKDASAKDAPVIEEIKL